ncbi:hypothetical protein PF010_g23517 [Phytophthora fragariae]|uniref:Uncharacterized protein n=1 Tax=Phytophthora fragariae TaxID=53985 RepID=A0A6A3D9P3_9STRA|nr:hypothetical protein PF009_g31511 [Phytophthora fragariae]KAE9059166.1 hypothetical protein PF007_g31045 [Phytophthora fragariae]KAE9061804.1 hypothetical protein PF006_g31307 [Phytophthora fragariae]KAE9077421.1 hypothetical protein PF010_g23517 [Phytophthora fragariae]
MCHRAEKMFSLARRRAGEMLPRVHKRVEAAEAV